MNLQSNSMRVLKFPFLLFSLIFSYSWIGFAQSSVDNTGAIRETIELFFEGFHERNEVKIRSVLDDQAIFHSLNENGEVTLLRTTSADQFLKAIVSRADSPEWEERLHTYTIEVDGSIAQAWVTYSFWLGGSFSHCGVDAFNLYKSDKKWKISYLIDSRRKENCDF